MITNSGASIWPRGTKFYKSDTEVPTLLDIGWGLSRIVRFAGQTSRFYNVLNHVLTVTDILPDEYAMVGLLHDAPEAVVSDVPTTWKTTAAKDREEELLERITKAHWGVDKWPWDQEARDILAEADYIALSAEAHVLGHAAAEKYWPWRAHANKPMFEIAYELTQERFATSLFQASNPGYGAELYEQRIHKALKIPSSVQ